MDGTADLFSDPDIRNIKVKVSKEDLDFDQSAFITGINKDNRLAFARIDTNADDFDFTSTVTRVELDRSFEVIEDLENYAITAGNEEHQMFIAAVVDTDTAAITREAEEVLLFQVSGDSSPVINCSYDFATTGTPVSYTHLTLPTTPYV